MTFDRPLKAGTTAVGSWFIRESNFRITPLAPLVILGTIISGALGLPLLDIGADVVSYPAPPYDVFAQNGVRLERFMNFPLTVIP